MRILKNITFCASLYLLFSYTASAQSQIHVDTNKKKNSGLLIDPDTPEPGYDITEYLSKHLHYSENAEQGTIQTREIVKFIVNEDGRISDVTILRSVGSEFDREVQRVITQMPKMETGISRR